MGGSIDEEPKSICGKMNSKNGAMKKKSNRNYPLSKKNTFERPVLL